MPQINIKPVNACLTEDLTKRPYWEQDQEDITIIFLDVEQQKDELADISEIENEIGIIF